MPTLDAASLLDNVGLRYQQDQIYTNVGNVLLAVNPHKDLPLYGPEIMQQHCNLIRQPHPFQVAEASLRSAKRGESQTIIVTGESGAGKTETAKILMRYLEANSSRWSQQPQNLSTGEPGRCQELVQKAALVLESFGHAATVRNSNSSRFGKCLRLRPSLAGSCWAKVDTLLLETSRLVCWSGTPGERTFHIFYDVVHGKSAHWCRRMHISAHHALLQQPQTTPSAAPQVGCHNFATYPESSAAAALRLQRLDSNLRDLGCRDGEFESICSVVAGLLHLGDFLSRQSPREGSLMRHVSSDASTKLAMAAECLGISGQDLYSTMLYVMLCLPKEGVIQKARSVPQVQAAARSLIITLYTGMFCRLVAKINEALRSCGHASASGEVNILDLYGFECLQHNGLEQLMINLANEKLQHLFTDCVIAQELQTYAKEGILQMDLCPVSRQSAIVQLEAALAIVDDHSDLRFNNIATTDERMVQAALAKARQNGPSCIGSAKGQQCFTVKHFAGEVLYSADGWLDSNDARPLAEVRNLIKTSSSPFVQALAPEMHSKQRTRSRSYRWDLSRLFSTLQQGRPRFIRCFRPNVDQVCGKIDRNYLMQQLCQSGTMELLTVMHHGFPHRLPLAEVAQRFTRVLGVRETSLCHSPRMLVEALLLAYNVPKSAWAVGVSQLFLKADQRAFLEELIQAASPPPLARLQSVVCSLRRRRLRVCMVAVRTCLRLRAIAAARTRCRRKLRKCLIAAFFVGILRRKAAAKAPGKQRSWMQTIWDRFRRSLVNEIPELAHATAKAEPKPRKCDGAALPASIPMQVVPSPARSGMRAGVSGKRLGLSIDDPSHGGSGTAPAEVKRRRM